MCDAPYYKKIESDKYNHEGAREYVLPLPCGRCLPCKRRMKLEWLFRMEQELKVAQTAYFVTLTYNDEYLPITEEGYMTLKYSDVQKYLKRLRVEHEKPGRYISEHQYYGRKAEDRLPIKYFCVGEYGSVGKRPHYHLIIFNANEEDLRKMWRVYKGNDSRNRPVFESIGIVDIGTVTQASIMYCLNYAQKGDQLSYGDNVPEFRKMSKGIGDGFLDNKYREKYELEELDEVALEDGTKLWLPRYYVKKFFYEEARQHRAERLAKKMRIDKEEFIKDCEAEGKDWIEEENGIKRINFVRLNAETKKLRKDV